MYLLNRSLGELPSDWPSVVEAVAEAVSIDSFRAACRASELLGTQLGLMCVPR